MPQNDGTSLMKEGLLPRKGKSRRSLETDNAKLRVCLRYAINRLTDDDLKDAPEDLRHTWVEQATRILTESEQLRDRK